MSALGWQHHTLIQSLLSRGPTSEKEFHDMFEGVSKKNPVNYPRIFNDVLLKINKELSYVQFELRGCRNQYDGEVYYGVVNNVADEQSKLGTKYTVPQIAFYKGVIEAIAQDGTAQGCISSIDALNLRLESQMTATNSESQGAAVPAALKYFSISQKEKTLDEFVRDKWLCHTSDGNIGLGVRSFLDLRSWFRGNDVPPCEVCNEAGVKVVIIFRCCMSSTLLYIV
uniref:Non-structural maintenance of chromosomes element 1 homolog n=1 Tax=Kalanchoe fedtschenkoi TaxID=63787 RepID=A0A7N0UR31_KALFE